MVALLSSASWCLVIVVWLFLAVPWVCLQFVIVVYPDHTHYFGKLGQYDQHYQLFIMSQIAYIQISLKSAILFMRYCAHCADTRAHHIFCLHMHEQVL